MEVNNHGSLMDAGVGKEDMDGMGNENSSFSKSDGTLVILHIKFTYTSLTDKKFMLKQTSCHRNLLN